MKKLSLLLLLISAVVIMPAKEPLKKVAQTGLQFLKVDVSPQAAAMGGAFTVVGNGAHAMFYNPAGLAKMENSFDFFASNTGWIADISYNAAGLVANLGNLGSVGISYMAADYGDIIGTRVAPTEAGFEETGNVEVGAYAVGIAYARSLTDKTMVGAQIKYAYQALGENLLVEGGETLENKVSGLAYDVGLIFYPGLGSFRLGMNVKNFSPQFKYEEEAFQLPLTFQMGMAMNIFELLGMEGNSLLVSVDMIHPRDYTERIHLGGEYSLMDMFAIRGGYKFNYDVESFHGGVGFNYNVSGIGINIDYSFSDADVFDPVSRFSLGLSF